jgi:hypothetical protein
LVSALGACLAAGDGRAQDQDAGTSPTAEQMIEAERELYRPPGLRRSCPTPEPGEIVVCEQDREEFRVDSSLDEAIRDGKQVHDGVPRAPDVSSLPSCEVVKCYRIGKPPERPLLIDLDALPVALTPEEAAHVFRAEDAPAEAANPEAASPAAVP